MNNPNSSEQKALYDKLQKEGMDKKQAALFAGYAPNTPDQPTKKITKALERNNVTDDRLAKTIDEGLSATDKLGKKDHTAIVKYLSIAGKWLGYEKSSLTMAVGLNVAGQVTDPNKLGDAIRVIEAELISREQNGPEQPA